MDESRVENLSRASSENGTATVIGLNWARNVVQVSAAVTGEERCVTRQITAAWETRYTREDPVYPRGAYFIFGALQEGTYWKHENIIRGAKGPVVQRADKFIQRITRYPTVDTMY